MMQNKEEEQVVQDDFFYDWRHIEPDQKIVNILGRVKELREFQDSSSFRRFTTAHLEKRRKGLPVVHFG